MNSRVTYENFMVNISGRNSEYQMGVISAENPDS